MLNKIYLFLRRNSFLEFIFEKIVLKKYYLLEKNTFNQMHQIEYKPKLAKTIQEEKLEEILQVAYKNTYYYKKIFDQRKINYTKKSDFKKIPILTKKDIRNNTSELLNKNIFIKRKANTGGSTGEPLFFYADIDSAFIDNGHHKFLYDKGGLKSNEFVAGSGGIKIPRNLLKKNIYWIKKEKGSIWGRYKFSALYLNNRTIRHYVTKMQELKPAILRGYPSFYHELAKYILKNKITFNVKTVILTAEMNNEEQISDIQKAFNSKVILEYGHSELSVFAYTNGKSFIYKTSPIYGYVEVIKNDGTDAKAGEEGKIIVTSLINKAMPFIRYDTGDRAIVHKNMNGIVEFKKILGREQDYIITKEKKKVYLVGLIFGQHLHAFRNIDKWQIIQTEIGKITIKIVKKESYGKSDESELIAKIKNMANIETIFEYCEYIAPNKNGKTPFMIQKIKL